MADPFELRLFFSNRLRAINPCDDSVSTAAAADDSVAAFALKHRELDEDLWSCVLEQLARADSSINVRANICYFLEDLVELARRERYWQYVRMVERDFGRVIDAVVSLPLPGAAEEDEGGMAGASAGLGVVNVNCVRYVLHALHYEMGVFARDREAKAEHDRRLGQTWETSTFEELSAYLEERARLARPVLGELSSDDESEPDMSWINAADAGSDTAKAMDTNTKNNETVATSLENTVADVVMADPHDLPSPPGTRSPSDGSTPLYTPAPPSPLSPSPPPSLLQRSQAPAITSPTPTTQPNGPDSTITSPSAPKIYSPVKISTSTQSTTAAPAPHSPSTFTPVQKEDASIFAPAYFDLASERIEQDRERQRRKEDSSGFVVDVVSGTAAAASSGGAAAAQVLVEDEVAQVLAGVGSIREQYWLEDLVAERVAWEAMGE